MRIYVVLSLLVASPTVTLAAEPLTVETLRPYLNNEINALTLHHLFIQSMFALDSTPLTVAAGVRAAPASYSRIDGKNTDAGLGKVLYAFSLGAGRPATGVAVFGGVNVSQVRPSGFPNVTALSGDEGSLIRAHSNGIVAFAGMAFYGWALELALFRKELGYDADDRGRFQPGGCDSQSGCSFTREPREGAPVAGPPRSYRFNDTSFMLHFEQKSGYSASLLLDNVRSINSAGDLVARRTISAFKALAQPEALAHNLLGAVGVGLNRYAAGVDYYGDRVEEVRADAANNDVPRAAGKQAMFEVPIISQGIAGTPFDARVVMQVYPRPIARLLEVGYSTSTTLWEELVPQAGVQAKLFYRGDGYVPSADAFLGIFWLYSRRAADPEAENKGLGIYASYSYNSPDSLTFLPVPDAHVLGIQVAYGNPMALPPPVPNLRYPEELLASTQAEAEAEPTTEITPASTEVAP